MEPFPSLFKFCFYFLFDYFHLGVIAGAHVPWCVYGKSVDNSEELILTFYPVMGILFQLCSVAQAS